MTWMHFLVGAYFLCSFWKYTVVKIGIDPFWFAWIFSCLCIWGEHNFLFHDFWWLSAFPCLVAFITEVNVRNICFCCYLLALSVWHLYTCIFAPFLGVWLSFVSQEMFSVPAKFETHTSIIFVFIPCILIN